MVEILKEVLHEITAQPVLFIAEIVQFSLLLGVILWVVPRFIGKRLNERRAKIAAELAEAEKAEMEYPRIKKEARVVIGRAEKEAREIIRIAKETVKKEREAAMAQADAEAKEIIHRAQETVEREKNRVIREASEHLVSLTTEITRRYLDEALTESQRRTLMEKAILQSLEKMERASELQALE
jgi:F-type H+-transporting ATPase subunit b